MPDDGEMVSEPVEGDSSMVTMRRENADGVTVVTPVVLDEDDDAVVMVADAYNSKTYVEPFSSVLGRRDSGNTTMDDE